MEKTRREYFEFYTQMKHVILIPTYNEAENIETILHALFSQYPNIYIKVIDDNSPDGTGTIVKKMTEAYSHLSLLSRNEKNGLGKAYINGFQEVLSDKSATHIIMMDADLSHNPMYIGEMIKQSSDYDVVIGSRYIAGGGTVGWEWWRIMLSLYGNLYARVITISPITDLTGGFNCISVSALKKINLDAIDSSGYAFQIELKYLLRSHGANVKEIPIIFANRTGGESKMSNHIISEGIRAPWRMVLRKRNNEKQNGSLVCTLCGEASSFFTRKNGFTVYKCSVCHFLFVSPLPSAVNVYTDDYFFGAHGGFGYVDYDADKRPMISTFERYIKEIHKLGFMEGRLLDVGCATGFFMEIAQQKGFDVSGVELSSFAVQKGREKGLSIIQGTLESDDFKKESFDVVTMCDVLEHVTDPKGFLSEAKRILRPGGILLINTPNAESFVARVFGKKWHLIVPPEHVHYFSPRNLGSFLAQNGFEVRVIKTIGKRFTFQYIFKTLYVWQHFALWNWLAKIFSHGVLSKLYIPLNTHDNFFMIAEKNV